MKKNYHLPSLMSYAWKIYRNEANKCESFGDALKRAWKAFDVADSNREKVAKACAEMGIDEVVRTWYGWTLIGRKVIHGEHAIIKVLLDTPEKGIGKTYLTSYFVYAQTDIAENVA